ncbi:MAG: TetR/AcrR family transcriptional regulator [Bacteroidota bacterium]
MQKTLKHEAKLNDLIDKGMMLLWSRGYNATSVNDIVQVADVPKGSFYFYFESKEDFAVKAIEKYFNQMFPPALAILQEASVSPKQRIIDFYVFRVKVLKEELDCKMGCMGCNLALEMAEHNEAIRNIINEKNELVRSHIQSVVEKAQEQGEIDRNVNAANLVSFMEDAGKGAMTTMKEQNSAAPINNFTEMLQTIILK